MKGHTAGIACLAFDATKTRMFSGGLDGNVLIWDIKVNSIHAINLTCNKILLLGQVDASPEFHVERKPLATASQHKV